METVKLFKVTEITDLDCIGRKDVRCHWFVMWRKRPLFGANGSLKSEGVFAAGDHAQECKFAAEEFFTADEAKTFAEFGRKHLEVRNIKVEPAKLPIPSDSISFERLLNERDGDLNMLLLHDDAGNELDFAVWCYEEPVTH